MNFDATEGADAANNFYLDFLAARTMYLWGLMGKLPGPCSQIIEHPVWMAIMSHFLDQKRFSHLDDKVICSKTTYQTHVTTGFRVGLYTPNSHIFT